MATSVIIIRTRQKIYFWNQQTLRFKMMCINKLLAIKLKERYFVIDKKFLLPPYHVTYHLMNIKKVTVLLGTSRFVIWVINWRVWIIFVKMVLFLRILTFCQFPDLPIASCEQTTHRSLAFDTNNQKKIFKISLATPFKNGAVLAFFGYLH